LALEVISLLSRNKECVTEISACEILGSFLRAMKDEDFQKQRVLDTLSGLTNAPQLVKEAHSKGESLDPFTSGLVTIVTTGFFLALN
jgi:DnaJ homolog subfamily C member 13